MGTLWLKKLDRLSKLVPASLVTPNSPAKAPQSICCIRPGGLGDLVVLTEAFLEQGIAIDKITWIVEKRNAPWLNYLGIPTLCYDNIKTLAELISSTPKFTTTICTEQYHGLAALLARKLTAKNGTLVGFDSNPRADLFTRTVNHSPKTEHELKAFSKLISAYPISRSSNLKIPDTDNRIKGEHAVVAFGGSYDNLKQLPLQTWVDLCTQAKSQFKEVIALGSKNELNLAAKVCELADIQNQVATLPFPEVVSTIAASKRVFGIDSGLIHVADFFKVPSTVFIQQKANTQWGPRTSGSKVENF